MAQKSTSPHSLRSAKAGALSGAVAVPGDKSISHRALMLSSQALGTTTINGLLEGDDVLNTAKALGQLGVSIDRQSGQWVVKGVGVGGLSASASVLDMGNSGTSTRLLMGLVTPYPFTTFFTGDESLCSRPMGRVIMPLMRMGATIVARDKDRLPLALTGTIDIMPISYKLPVASAQVKSAILLAGLNTRGKTTVIEPAPTRDHTENMLEFFGFKIERGQTDEGLAVSLQGQQNIPFAERTITVPADPSSAAFPIVAALICEGSSITLKNVCVNPLRTGLFVTLKEMGAKILFKNERIVAGEKVADIEVAHGALKGVIVPASRAPSMIDEYPILAVAAAFAKGETVMHGLSELRVKESNRLSAIVEALNRCGVKARAEGDSLYVQGGNVKGGASINTRFDHRIAMSFLVLGMASNEPVTIDDDASINTSFPGFAELINGLGARIGMTGLLDNSMTENATLSHLVIGSSDYPLVIAVDGPAASGKGTLARRLAEHFGLDYLDTGSLYRAVGMKLVYAGKDPTNRDDALAAAKSIDANDLTNPRLRQERIGKAASIVSAFPEVRQALLEFQRSFSRHSKGAVLDGRDIGTVVCPDADFKFFITATLYARARRRHRELTGEGIEVVFESVLEDLRERDERDEKRTIAPLKPAEDAVVLDTSDMDASTVFEQARTLIERNLNRTA